MQYLILYSLALSLMALGVIGLADRLIHVNMATPDPTLLPVEVSLAAIMAGGAVLARLRNWRLCLLGNGLALVFLAGYGFGSGLNAGGIAPFLFSIFEPPLNQTFILLVIVALAMLLMAAVRGSAMLRLSPDLSSRRDYLHSESSFQTGHDELTGLLTRPLLEDRIRQACRISRLHGRYLAVIFVDLDEFKPLVEFKGRQVGDQILIATARRLEQQMRAGGSIARLDDDEFVMLLPDLLQEEDVVPVVERAMDSIAKPHLIADQDLRLTASIGITISQGDANNAEEIILQARTAMNEAKKQGLNNYQWYNKRLDQETSERVTLRSPLQKAIEQHNLELHYQPQIDARTNRVLGFEALCRWQDSELGYISPDRFIPVAEDTGQIVPLSEWVLETACRDNRALCMQGLSDHVVAVNISPVHFQRANFVDSIKNILRLTEHPAELLELELTETVLLNDPARAIDTLQQLKQLGVRLAIDDFGTGFSSLNYLKLLPINKIKIDRSFVTDIVSDPRDAAITLGIISMAHHLKLKVTVEGIETEPQRAFLTRSHCDEFQGYMFAKPMPADELAGFLRQRRTEALISPNHDTSRRTLLLVDDDENILRALRRVLRREGYQILQATSAQEAFGLLALHEVQVILSDQRMPSMTGTEFFSQVKELYPDTIRIILSGYTDLKSVTEAINQGAIYKFLTKPWDDAVLRMNIAQAFSGFRMQTASDKPGQFKELP